MNISDLQQFLQISESSIETAKLAVEAIEQLHCKYCELYRNEIDNLWHKSDGRYKFLSDMVKARTQFTTMIQVYKHKEKAKK